MSNHISYKLFMIRLQTFLENQQRSDDVTMKIFGKIIWLGIGNVLCQKISVAQRNI